MEPKRRNVMMKESYCSNSSTATWRTSWNKSRYRSPALSLRQKQTWLSNKFSKPGLRFSDGGISRKLCHSPFRIGRLMKVFPHLLFSPIFILPSPFSDALPAKALWDHADRNQNNLSKAYFSSASVPPGPWATDGCFWPRSLGIEALLVSFSVCLVVVTI